MKFNLTEITTLKNIPGASGIGINDKHIYIIGDNSPYLYQLDLEAKPLASFPIYPTDDFKEGKIIKKLKPDFEALELIKGENHDELLIFGSGSKSPQRDIFVHVTLSAEPQIKTYNLVPFYDQLREMEILSGFELNIEAVAFHGNRLLLFNRGKNLILDFDYGDFHRYLNDEISFTKPTVTELKLPQIKGFVSGFSGATVIPDTKKLIFTTSVEDTPNAYDDGEVLGSFICITDMEQIDAGLKCFLIEEDNQPLKVKVESVAILKQISKNELELLMVTDSDGDESLLLKGLLTL
jgi:hypothetical protein